jgi:HD-GYP domain-containing protein (c-di-GMP phosphodiesterase class II)
VFDEVYESTRFIVEGWGSLELRVIRQSIYVNGIRIRTEIDNFAALGHVLRTLQRAGVGVIQSVGLPDRREWEVFLTQLVAFARQLPEPDQTAELGRALLERGVRRISVGPQPEGDSAFPDELERKRAARATYQQSVAVSRELFEGTRMGRAARVRQIKHAVQGIVDQVLHNEASLGGLSALKDYDDYAFTHSVNVCIFCVAIGKRLGLTKRQLYDLGLAALVHDLGMSRIPAEILMKGGKLSQEEQRQMQAHTWLGALSVFNLRDYGGIPYQSMIAAYEHHMKADLSGYPSTIRPRRQSIFSKIIGVASAFDAATNTRSYSAAQPPDEVLRAFWEKKHLGFDPVIVKALINLLGIYPVGTCVILDTFELGLVHDANSDPDFVHRPVVRILSDQNGHWLDDPPLADLAETDPDGTFRRTIIKVTDPSKYGIDVRDLLV